MRNHNEVIRRAPFVLLISIAVFALVLGCSSGRDTNASERSTQTTTAAPPPAQPVAAAPAQTIEGCIVQRKIDFYIQPKTGDQTKISASGQDVAPHVGHNVRLTGSMNSQQGASSAGSGTSSDEFVVTQVDMITEACPNEIQKRIEQQTKVLKSQK